MQINVPYFSWNKPDHLCGPFHCMDVAGYDELQITFPSVFSAMICLIDPCMQLYPIHNFR